MLDERGTVVEEAFKWNEKGDEEVYQGIPLVRDRFYYSFIWDRFGDADMEKGDLGGGILVDPTNQNLDIDREIRKLVKIGKTSKKSKLGDNSRADQQSSYLKKGTMNTDNMLRGLSIRGNTQKFTDIDDASQVSDNYLRIPTKRSQSKILSK